MPRFQGRDVAEEAPKKHEWGKRGRLPKVLIFLLERDQDNYISSMTPKNAAIQEALIAIEKSGKDFNDEGIISFVRDRLGSCAADPTIWSYVSKAGVAAALSEDEENENQAVFWRFLLSPSLRNIVTDVHDATAPLPVTDLLDQISSRIDREFIGDSVASVFCKVRICVAFLNALYANGRPLPEDW